MRPDTQRVYRRCFNSYDEAAIIVAKRCANGHSTEFVFVCKHSRRCYRGVLPLPESPPRDFGVARARVCYLLSAVLLSWNRKLTVGASGLVRASARTLGVGKLHAPGKDERHSNWRNMVARTMERTHPDWVFLGVPSWNGLGSTQHRAAAGMEIEPFMCQHRRRLHAGFPCLFLRVLPLLPLDWRNRALSRIDRSVQK
jgi:hypothetical protein